MPSLLLANPDSFRIGAIGPERGLASGADPFVAALVPLLLLLESFFERFHQLVPSKLLDLGHFLRRQCHLGKLAKPFLRNFGGFGAVGRLQSLEDLAEHLIEPVQQTLVLHIGGPCQIIKCLHPVIDDTGLHRLKQGQMFLEGGRNPGGAQFIEKIEKHDSFVAPLSRLSHCQIIG